MTDAELAAIMAYYSVVFSREIPDVAEAIWAEKLGGLEAADVRRAIDRLALKSYPPNVVQIAMTAAEGDGPPLFGEVFAELVEAASTCDWFDPNPPETLSPPAYALARSLGWPSFRVSDPTSTYYLAQAERRFAEIMNRANQRSMDGRPAFDSHMVDPELGGLIDGIGGEDD